MTPEVSANGFPQFLPVGSRFESETPCSPFPFLIAARLVCFFGHHAARLATHPCGEHGWGSVGSSLCFRRLPERVRAGAGRGSSATGLTRDVIPRSTPRLTNMEVENSLLVKESSLPRDHAIHFHVSVRCVPQLSPRP